MATPSMLRQLRHDVWATGKLIAYCRGLTDAQLALTAPGTFGTVRRTLQHIVGADEDYLKKLGIPLSAVRLKCALLSLHVLKLALGKTSDVGT